VLAEHLSRAGLTGADDNELVFTAPGGCPLRYSNFRDRMWGPATKRVGLEGLGFHDLRRAAATTMVAAGVDVRTAQERLGHSDPRMTLAVYARRTFHVDRAAAQALGASYFPPVAALPLSKAL
jgi:integrase